AGADAHGLQAVEDVQLGQAQPGQAVDLDSATQDHGVEPAAATGTAGGGTELVAFLRQVGAHFVEQLGRERAGTDAGGVGLGDAEDVVQEQRAETGAGGGAASSGVGAGDVRVGAVVDVQQRALGAVEHDVLAGATQVV